MIAPLLVNVTAFAPAFKPVTSKPVLSWNNTVPNVFVSPSNVVTALSDVFNVNAPPPPLLNKFNVGTEITPDCVTVPSVLKLAVLSALMPATTKFASLR